MLKMILSFTGGPRPSTEPDGVDGHGERGLDLAPATTARQRVAGSLLGIS